MNESQSSFKVKVSFVTFGEIMTVWKNKTTYFLSWVVQCGWDVLDTAGMKMVKLLRFFFTSVSTYYFKKMPNRFNSNPEPLLYPEPSGSNRLSCLFLSNSYWRQSSQSTGLIDDIWPSVLTDMQVKCISHCYTHTRGGRGEWGGLTLQGVRKELTQDS